MAQVQVNHQIIIVGENDKKSDGSWPGRDGAQSLASQLATHLQRPIYWALPPEGYKDTREWLTSSDRGEMPWIERGQLLAQFYCANAIEVQPATESGMVGGPVEFPAEKPLDNKRALEEIVRLAK